MVTERTSRLSEFYKLSNKKRLEFVREFANLTDQEISSLQNFGLEMGDAERMSENVVGGFSVPIGIGANFLINKKDYLIPMATEESSVIAAASNGAKIARSRGGFIAKSQGSQMRAQIQVANLPDFNRAEVTIIESKDFILKTANKRAPTLNSLGGGAKDLKVRRLRTDRGDMLVVELFVDCQDAMGGNTCNNMAEEIAPIIASLSGGRVVMGVVSNLASERLVTATALFDKEALGGGKIVEAILDADSFARSDPYRGVTHNKGIMNGVVAVGLATGQDTRALEAGVHSYASLGGRYRPLTSWKANEKGDLIGTLEMPIVVGTIGGASTVHPIAKICLKILGVSGAPELAEVMASVGLAQNLAALRALVSEGIQKGHMRLHAQNIAISAGATGPLVEEISGTMIREEKISFNYAKKLLSEKGA